MNNPGQKLKRYIGANYPGLVPGPVESSRREHAVSTKATINSGRDQYVFTLGFPRSAPENGRPLCTVVRRNDRVLWSYEHDVRPYIGLHQKTRVHLYEQKVDKNSIFVLVVVSEGDLDVILSVLRVDGHYYSDTLEAVLKTTIAKLWGMRCELTVEEKVELEKLMPPRQRK